MTSDELYKKWNTIGLIPDNLEYGDCIELSRRLESIKKRLENYIVRVDSVNELFPRTILPVITRMYMVDEDIMEMEIFEDFEKHLREHEDLYNEFKNEYYVDCELELIELFMKSKGYE